jgi:uncharacterized membrane protein
MIQQAIIFLVAGAMTIYGVVFTFKYSGWPSAMERQNKALRAVKTGFSSTVMVVGLLLLYFDRTAPETFLTQWTFSSIAGAILLVIPLFLIMTAGSFVQFSSWKETRMTNQLRKMMRHSTKNNKSHE